MSCPLKVKFPPRYHEKLLNVLKKKMYENTFLCPKTKLFIFLSPLGAVRKGGQSLVDMSPKNTIFVYCVLSRLLLNSPQRNP